MLSVPTHSKYIDMHSRGPSAAPAACLRHRAAFTCVGYDGRLVMKKYLFALILVVMTAPALAAAGGAAVSEEEAHSIGVDAYLYFYPLVTMDMRASSSLI